MVRTKASGAFWQSEIVKWGDVIKKANIVAE